MKSFKEWVLEAFIDPTIKTSAASSWNLSKMDVRRHRDNTEHIGENDTHTFHKINKEEKGGVKSVVYYAKKKNSDSAPHLTIHGSQIGNDVHIDAMSKHPRSSIKMHEFIKHLVGRNLRLGSNHFSVGGAHVFNKLEDDKDVEISHFKDHKKISKGEKYGDDKYTTEKEATYLVAHKKTPHTFAVSDMHKALNENRNEEYDELHSRKLQDKSHADAVKKYTKGSFSLNNYLHMRHDGTGTTGHTGTPIAEDPHMEKRKRELDSVFADKKNHVGRRIHVMSGLSESPEVTIKRAEKSLGGRPSHIHLHHIGYMSTTDDHSVAHKFAEQDENLHKHIMHITVPEHHPAISVEQHSVYTKRHKDGTVKSSEREFLLHRGTHLKLDTKPEIDEDGTHHWFARVVGRHEE